MLPRTSQVARQSLAVFDFPDALLRLEVVLTVTGLSRSALYRRIQSGSFCQPVRLNSRCSRWRAGDVQAWLRAQANGGAHV